jgi:chromatin remodeling complex protein RSC6
MRRILPDKKLQKLLKVTADDEVTYFNLQKYMKVHFPKKEVATSSA